MDTIYRITLVLTGLINIGMAFALLRHHRQYTKYPTYRLTRILTMIWLIAFGVGYMIHAAFNWRDNWPTAASALAGTYFHLGAICFSWGYTSLLDPTYLTRKVIIRDAAIYIVGLIAYWTVALLWNNAPAYTLLSFSIFFAYAVIGVIIFYRTYNRVSYRMMKMSVGSVGNFVRWMQVCCDLIILFGISSVAITGIFPNDKWPYVLLLIAGVGMFGYIVYSLEKYGTVIDDATRETFRVTAKEKGEKGKSSMRPYILQIALFIAAVCTAFILASCDKQQQTELQTNEVENAIDMAHRAHDYDKILALSDSLQQKGALSDIKASYWRGYAYSRQHKMRLAEKEWTEAVALGTDNANDLEYYAKAANRLAGLLYQRFDYEGTIRVAVPAMDRLNEHNYTLNNDYANLHAFVGCCQLRLGHLEKANANFNTAYLKYRGITEGSSDLINYTSAIVGIINIVNVYLLTDHYNEAYEWISRLDTMLQHYREQPNADGAVIDKEWARLNFYRGCALEGMGRKDEAEEAYKTALTTQYAHTSEGQIEATNYLMAARRWSEAAEKFEMLEGVLTKYDMKMTLDNISTFLLPKFAANVGANRTDSAIAVGMWIKEVLDTAIVWERKDASIELATLYDMQQKENNFVAQNAALSHQRFLSAVITLIIVIVGFSLFIYFRHQAAMRLESAYHDLEIANARAEESSRIKSEFIQQISHEIRTPLNILSGYSQILTTSDAQLDESTRQDVNQQITENANRITALINKMLELSDARSKTVIECTDKVTAMEIAADAVADSGIDSASHLTFDLQAMPETENIVLSTNQSAAVRALTLLLDNARKFTAPAEAITRNFHDYPLEKKQAVLRLKASANAMKFIVEDNGISIPKEEAERIFEEFVQLDEYYDGTGIGLTVARSIARRLGGDVVLDTSFIRGARFIMTLPL